MYRALAVAVVELDAMSRSAAEKGCVQQIGAPRAARHWDAAGLTHRGQHPFSAVRNVASGAANHDADGVEEMPARIMADLGVERAVGQAGDERDAGRRRARRGLQGVDGFSMRHDGSPRRALANTGPTTKPRALTSS